MKKQTECVIKEALAKLRADLRTSWGYAPEIAEMFNTTPREIYNVAHGRKKNPLILKALIERAQGSDPSIQLLAGYLSASTQS